MGAIRGKVDVSSHAVSRYRERVEPVDYDTAVTRLSTPAVQLAASIGAPYVKLPGGQRIALAGHTVATVLPANVPPGYIARWTGDRA